MTEPFVAEIRMFGGPFAIRNWAFCNGQTMPITQNTTLYSLLGNTFGGDGRSTFGLPNFQGIAPTCYGTTPPPGVSARQWGETGGSSTVTLATNTMPAHTHTLKGLPRGTSVNQPSGDTVFGPGQAYASGAANAPMSAAGTSVVGGGGSHNNMQPYLAVNFLIALYGVFPQRP